LRFGDIAPSHFSKKTKYYFSRPLMHHSLSAGDSFIIKQTGTLAYFLLKGTRTPVFESQDMQKIALV